MKTRIFGLIFTFIAMGLLFATCQKASQPLGESTPELKKAVKDDWSYKSYGASGYFPINDATHVPPLGPGDALTVPLYAGKTQLVGDVTIDQQGENIVVTFNLNQGVTLLSTHVSITGTEAQIPYANGNPSPGLFNCNKYGIDGVYTIPISELPKPVNNTFIVLAHAVVNNCNADWEALTALIPVTIVPAHFEGNDQFLDAYFHINFPEGPLNGIYPGWCVDRDHHLYPPTDMKVKFVSTYDPNFASLVSGLIDKPANINAVNWILNKDFVGKPSPCGGGNYTYGDVQMAIWRFIENKTDISDQGNPVEARYMCIYEAALEHLDFVPTCGQQVGIVLIPVDEFGVYNNVQPTLISIPMPCDCDEETAWAMGEACPGSNWAMWFKYIVTP